MTTLLSHEEPEISTPWTRQHPSWREYFMFAVLLFVIAVLCITPACVSFNVSSNQISRVENDLKALASKMESKEEGVQMTPLQLQEFLAIPQTVKDQGTGLDQLKQTIVDHKFNQENKLKELETKLLQKISSIGSTPPTTVNNPTKDPNEKLVQEIATLKGKIESITMGQEASNRLLEELKKSYHTFKKEDYDKFKEKMQTNVGKEKERTASLIKEKDKLEQDKKELETSLHVQTAKLAESNKLLKELGLNELKVAEEDVLIVFLSSDQLRLSTYLTVFKELFLGANAPKLPGRMRLGLVEIVGKEVMDIVPLETRKREDMERNFSRITPPPSGSTARLEEVGKLIAERFPEKKAGRGRRCILVTSVTCVPVPEKELKDWDDLNVSTILVGNRQNRNLVLNPSFEWWGFGARAGAGVTLLWTNKNPEDKDVLVLEGLKKCLRPLVQPQLLPPKENNP